MLSAASDVSLRRLAESYADLIRACPEKFSDICRAANTTRSQMIRRLSIVADTSDQLVAALRAYARDGRLSKGATASTVQGEIPHVGFLFTGQGSQYIGMGKELYETHPVFRKIMQQCDELLRPYLQRSLLELIFLSDQATLSQTRYTQPALFAIEYALAEMCQPLRAG